MAGSKQYRFGVAAGINWRTALVNFNKSQQRMSKRQAKRAGKDPEWARGFRVGYNFQRRAK